TVQIRVRPVHPVIERRALIANNSARPMRAVRLDSVSLGMVAPVTPAWEVSAVSSDGVVRQATPLSGQSVVALASLVSGVAQESIPYLVVRDTRTGHGLFAGLRWSSNWYLSATMESDEIPYLRCGLHLDDSEDDSLILAPDSLVQGPWSFIGFFAGDSDDAAHVVYDYVEDTARPHPPWFVGPPVVWNSWFAYLTEVEEARLLADAYLAAQLGVEVFYVDYGWSSLLGDWKPDPLHFPNGLKPLVNRVHDLGMKFGLWVAFGDALAGSTLLQDHPDFLAIQPEPAAVGIDGAQVFCLTQAEDWISSELDRIVTDYHVDWLKFDQPMITACRATDHSHEPNRAGSLLANNMAFYRILERLSSKHPDMVIENCFNGAGYLDYGVRRYTNVSWLTDDSGNSATALARVQQTFYGISYGFRPSYLQQWLAAVIGIPSAPGRTTSLRDLSYQGFTSMVGAWGISLPLSELDEDQLALVAGFVSQY
ncbi:MAG: alpha-galactosidase, partial [Dehalococcoidia bacterium]|nr:alpha-galactosidase [Dehalococcoidia bacterium]